MAFQDTPDSAQMVVLPQVMYSLNGEEFVLAELNDVLNQLERQGELQEGVIYYVASCERVRPGPFDVAADILELLHTKTYLQAGDAADVDVANVDQAAKDTLNDLVNHWTNDQVNIAYFWKPILPVISARVTAGDMQVHAGVPPRCDLDDDVSDSYDSGFVSHSHAPVFTAGFVQAPSTNLTL